MFDSPQRSQSRDKSRPGRPRPTDRRSNFRNGSYRSNAAGSGTSRSNSLHDLSHPTTFRKNHGREGYQPHQKIKTEDRKTPHLSDKELAERRAAGKCFGCGEIGHVNRNCPQKNVVHSSGSRPPGKSAFNIEPLDESNEPNNDSVEILDSLPLGAIFLSNEVQTGVIASDKWLEYTAPVFLSPLDEWREHYPRWKEQGVWARRQIGDCYALVS